MQTHTCMYYILYYIYNAHINVHICTYGFSNLIKIYNDCPKSKFLSIIFFKHIHKNDIIKTFIKSNITK